MFLKLKIKCYEKKYPCLAEYHSAKQALLKIFEDEREAYDTYIRENTIAAKNRYIEIHSKINSISENYRQKLTATEENISLKARKKYFRLLDKLFS